MKNKLIFIFIIALLGVIITVVVMDFNSSKTKDSQAEIHHFYQDSLNDTKAYPIDYTEIKQINLNFKNLHAIDVLNGVIYIAADNSIKLISEKGKLQANIPTDLQVGSIKVSDDKQIIIAYKNYITILDSLGSMISKSEIENDTSVFTSIAILDSTIFIADAGNRKVIIYNLKAVRLGSFTGVYNASNDRLGFIVPSPYFDLIVNNSKELWVVNPGTHSIQNYSTKGDLIDFWTKSSNSMEGFVGCCNPAHITVLDNGSIVTAEKGHVRIKVYSNKGELLSIVAPSDSFTEKGKAPDIVAEGDKIFALDFDKKLIRIFKKNNDE